MVRRLLPNEVKFKYAPRFNFSGELILVTVGIVVVVVFA